MKVLLGKVSRIYPDGNALVVIPSAERSLSDFLTVSGLDVYEGQPVEVVIQPLQVMKAGASRRVVPTRPSQNKQAGPKTGATSE